MPSGKSLDPVWKAFDEAEFGLRNILNLRESLPTATDARHRAEAWLRERQISRSTEVLLITGRGNRSVDGISAVREEILSLLPTLRRRGVVVDWREHSPGSFAIKLASIASMLDAPRRKRDRDTSEVPPDPAALKALDAKTLSLLRQLAVRSLESLGAQEVDKFIEGEMLAKFQSLAAGIGPGAESERKLRDAIAAALEQLDE
jgi:hypothetical protein